VERSRAAFAREIVNVRHDHARVTCPRHSAIGRGKAACINAAAQQLRFREPRAASTANAVRTPPRSRQLSLLRQVLATSGLVHLAWDCHRAQIRNDRERLTRWHWEREREARSTEFRRSVRYRADGRSARLLRALHGVQTFRNVHAACRHIARRASRSATIAPGSPPEARAFRMYTAAARRKWSTNDCSAISAVRNFREPKPHEQWPPQPRRDCRTWRLK
jgi:hypothetical protein